MKKILCVMAVLACVGVSAARGDSYTYSTTVTNTQHATYSDPLPISGWLDKVEFVQDAAATSTFVLATYDGTTAIDTYCTTTGIKTAAARAGHVFRPRFYGTTSGGVTLTPAQLGTNDVFNPTGAVLYERPMIGGNVKVALTGTANAGTNAISVRIYFEPLAK